MGGFGRGDRFGVFGQEDQRRPDIHSPGMDDGTREMPALTTQELARSLVMSGVRRMARPTGGRPWGLVVMALGLAALAGVWIAGNHGGPIEIRDLVIEPGLEEVVITFSTDSLVAAHLESRAPGPGGEEGTWEVLAREAGPGTEHRFQVRVPDSGRELRVAAGATRSLPRRVEPPPALVARLEVLAADPLGETRVRVLTHPPARGRLILGPEEASRPVELQGEPGREEGVLPPPADEVWSGTLAYEGDGRDGSRGEAAVAFRRAGLEARIVRLLETAEAAREAFRAQVFAPATDGLLGTALGSGGKQRAPAADWLEDIPDLVEAAGLVRPVLPRVLDRVWEDGRAYELYRTLAGVARVEAALRRDLAGDGGIAPARWPRVAELVNALAPPVRLGSEAGTSVLPAPATLAMSGAGIIVALQTDVTHAVRLDLPDFPLARRVELMVECEAIREDLYLELGFGPEARRQPGRRPVVLGPAFQPDPPRTGPWRRYGVRVPTGWLRGEAWLRLRFVEGAPAGPTARVRAVRVRLAD